MPGHDENSLPGRDLPTAPSDGKKARKNKPEQPTRLRGLGDNKTSAFDP
jgi:hypothetical protein